ncbi:MAG TPA: type I CRISPR-associated protein Cas7 [Candidatus Paceibacterota bacterium]|nr:type I CRISPR-associated protein Cas7 [Candidatus Paceibacterota bacterium]
MLAAAYGDNAGFIEDDLALFWQALTQIFDDDRSASRGTMAPRKPVVFKHQSALRNAQAHRLFERVAVPCKPSTSSARRFTDYDVAVHKTDPPSDIERIELL